MDDRRNERCQTAAVRQPHIHDGRVSVEFFAEPVGDDFEAGKQGAVVKAETWQNRIVPSSSTQMEESGLTMTSDTVAASSNCRMGPRKGRISPAAIVGIPNPDEFSLATFWVTFIGKLQVTLEANWKPSEMKALTSSVGFQDEFRVTLVPSHPLITLDKYTHQRLLFDFPPSYLARKDTSPENEQFIKPQAHIHISAALLCLSTLATGQTCSLSVSTTTVGASTTYAYSLTCTGGYPSQLTVTIPQNHAAPQSLSSINYAGYESNVMKFDKIVASPAQFSIVASQASTAPKMENYFISPPV